MIRPGRALAAATSILAALLIGCAPTPASAPGQPQATVSVFAGGEAWPVRVEVRSQDGSPVLASGLHPQGVVRTGAGEAILDPVDERPAWWSESGLPVKDAQETVVIVGHNYNDRTAPFAALRDVVPGDEVIVRTSAGALRYQVERVEPLAKGALLGEHELRQHVPGRLILANCDVRDGVDTGDNYLVIAQFMHWQELAAPPPG